AGDPDDRWRSWGLSRLAAALVTHNTELAVGRNARFEAGEELPPGPSLRELQGVHNSIDLYDKIDRHDHPFPWHPMTFMARTELVRRTGGWPAVPLGADLGLLLNMLTHSAHGKTAVVPDVVRDRHKWSQQVTALHKKAELDRWVEIARRQAANRIWCGRLAQEKNLYLLDRPRPIVKGGTGSTSILARLSGDYARAPLSPTAEIVPARTRRDLGGSNKRKK
ncbi:MAG: hypothetical protein ACRDTD_32865, partial [Pseudonocardiaceae bacterium]